MSSTERGSRAGSGQPIELKQTQPGKIASGERRGHGERVCGDEVKQIQSGEMAVTELRSRGERFRGDELNRPHSSLDGLTPYEFANRFGKDHKVNRANL